MDALALLRGQRYEINPGDEFSADRMPMGTRPDPRSAQPTQSSAGALVPMGEAEAMPSRSMGQPQQVAAAQDPMGGQSQYPDWMDDAQKSLYERGKRASANYEKAVNARRQRRRADREYTKLYNQFEKHKDAHDTLEHLQKEYPDMFRPDDPRTIGMIKQQMMHINEAKLTRDKLLSLLKKHGIKVGPKDNMPDSLYGESEENDKAHDAYMKNGFIDAMMYRGEDN